MASFLTSVIKKGRENKSNDKSHEELHDKSYDELNDKSNNKLNDELNDESNDELNDTLNNDLNATKIESSVLTQHECKHEAEKLKTNCDKPIFDQQNNMIESEHSPKTIKQRSSPFNNRIKITNIIRRFAHAGPKPQAEDFLQSTRKKQKLINFSIGDNVLILVPDVDRGPTDAHNILGVIIEIKHNKLKLGTKYSTLHGYYSFHQVEKAPGEPTLEIQDIIDNTPRSVREIMKLESITGGQGILKCDCKQGCKTNKGKCKQADVLCNSRCHHTSSCCNK
ncbi:unnamed protein product [Rotaria sordida]|uniref:Uncharacterized protein n=1 Tax=Rotaria sordida TaxID=392033 RepID=A0A819QIC9_9BILA|nr:unnamed protein product [Rotaria sordida]CAF4024761.1 unnamed protein product [Rotaria sordida]CAF4083569.1 unnamed protein product [Rotaria sordida]CAF4106575.1 unnamed protein product [Rotaria sordida]